jgi:hypothetical protein
MEGLGGIWSHSPIGALRQFEVPSAAAAFSATKAFSSTAPTTSIHQPGYEEVLYNTEFPAGDQVPYHTELDTSWQNLLRVYQ